MKLSKQHILLFILAFSVGTYFLLRFSGLSDVRSLFKGLPSKIEKPTLPIKPSCECPENGWINCMPAVGSDKKTQCSAECVDWLKKNCPNFQGVAY